MSPILIFYQKQFFSSVKQGSFFLLHFNFSEGVLQQTDIGELRNSREMEAYIFLKASTREKYLAMAARVIHHLHKTMCQLIFDCFNVFVSIRVSRKFIIKLKGLKHVKL